MTGIYAIYNYEKNKIYIGQSIDIARRWQQHIQKEASAAIRPFRFFYILRVKSHYQKPMENQSESLFLPLHLKIHVQNYSLKTSLYQCINYREKQTFEQ